MIRHLVHLRFADGVTAADRAAILDRLAGLSAHLEGMLDFQARANVSPETALAARFPHMFWVDFRDAAARDAYLADPAHAAAGAALVAMLDGGRDGLFVCDIEL